MARRYLTFFTLPSAALVLPLAARFTGETPVNSYTFVHLDHLGSGFTTAFGA